MKTKAEQHIYSDLIEEIRTDGLRTKSFTWKDLATGNCHETGGTVLLISDGRGKFNCTTWTDKTHSGDTWQAVFSAYDQYKLQLFSVGPFNSPRMSDGGPKYPWEATFNFPPQNFDAVVSIIQGSTC